MKVYYNVKSYTLDGSKLSQQDGSGLAHAMLRVTGRVWVVGSQSGACGYYNPIKQIIQVVDYVSKPMLVTNRRQRECVCKTKTLITYQLI